MLISKPELFFDLKNKILFKRDNQNIAFEVTGSEIPAMKGVSGVDLFLTRGHIREPHWHPNAGELDMVIAGKVIIGILDPEIPKLLTYKVGPGEAAYVPMGWWHWIDAASDEAHLHVIFNHEEPQTVAGSDVLRLTPPGVFEKAYSVNAGELKKVLAPINSEVFIGPANRNAPPPKLYM